MDDQEFLNWIADRLVHVHGEDENVDFVRKLRNVAASQRTEKEICDQRGHQPSVIILASNPPMNRCKWCRTVYRFDTVLVEQ